MILRYIKTSALQFLVLDAIQHVGSFAISNGEEFMCLVREAPEPWSAEKAKEREKRLAKHLKRHAELDSLIKRLYGEIHWLRGLQPDRRIAVDARIFGVSMLCHAGFCATLIFDCRGGKREIVYRDV
jgi:transposase